MEKIIYSKSLIAKLTLSRGFMIESYQTIMDTVLCHNKVEIKSSFFKDRVTYKGKKIAIIKGFKKNLVLYFAMNPSEIDPKYGITDVSNTKSYKNYPSKLIIVNEKDLVNATKILEQIFDFHKSKKLIPIEDVDYNLVYPEKTFDELFEAGLIKKYIRNFPDPEDKQETNDVVELVNVKFKVMVKGKMPEELYLITNYSNWKESIPLEKKEDLFVLNTYFPKNISLEFKISFTKDWKGVEKGMFGEEIRNHSYVLNNDIEIEDIIYNFRKD